MKFYHTPGTCSQGVHIALHEARFAFEPIKVDLKTHSAEGEGDFTAISAKAYVPALVMDDGQLLTENVAILSWIAEAAPQLAPGGTMGRVRLIEMLAFITSEIHKPFIQLFFPASDAGSKIMRDGLNRRFQFIADRLGSNYLLGDSFTVADAYFFVMLQWANMLKFELPVQLTALAKRIGARPAALKALRAEGFA
jgi:glutathione S-transferase